MAFLNSGDNKEKFEIIAGVILALQDDDSLTWAKDTYRVKFLMDNSEVYWGLRSMAKLEEVVFGDLTAAQTYDVKAEQIRQGIDNELFDLDTGLYRVAKFENGEFQDADPSANPDVDTLAWYPKTVAIAWPHLFNVTGPHSDRAQAQMDTLNYYWDGSPNPDWTNTIVDTNGFLFPSIGHAALLAGDRTRAEAHATFVRNQKFPSFDYPFTVDDGGWLLMTLAKLAAGNDFDLDGIADDVDISTTFSHDFSDGETIGTITSRGDQILTIIDSPSPNDGVMITADPWGAATVATVSACSGNSTFTLSAGDEVIVTCSSVTLDVISGTVEITLVATDGTPATTTLSGGNSLTFEPETAVITAPASNPDPVVVVVDGREITIEPGEETDVTLPPLPHLFLLLADKKVKMDGAAVSRGLIHANDKIEFKKGNPSTHSGNLTAVGNIKIDKDNVIAGDATAGGKLDLKGNANVTGLASANAAVASEALPILSFSAGGDKVYVKKNETHSLEPGSYGDLMVDHGGKLELSNDGISGYYFFEKLDLKDNSTLAINAIKGPVTINAVKLLHFHKGTEVTITHSFADNGSRFVTFNSLNNVDVQKGALVLGSIIAPKKKVHFHKEVSFQGAICAKEIDIDNDVTLLHHDSTSASILVKVVNTDFTDNDEDEQELEDIEIPTEYALSQNYPNPFNPSTTINFALPEADHVVLKIYSLLGEEVRILVDKDFDEGYHTIQWDGKNNNRNPVSSGIYLYKIQAGDFSQVKKMSLLR